MKRTLATLAPLVLLVGTLVATATSAPPKTTEELRFSDVRQQTSEFIGYYKSIPLTPEQESIKREALSSIPAPCCSNNTALTCCCPCNMAKSWWGLSHYLIAKQGYDAPRVKAKVEEWIRFINPAGFPGDTCSTGGCGRPFHKAGCGGMGEAISF